MITCRVSQQSIGSSQPLRRRVSGSSLNSVDSEAEPEYKPRSNLAIGSGVRSQNSVMDGFRVASNTPSRNSSRSSIEPFDLGQTVPRRYASPQTGRTMSRGLFENSAPIVAGRSGTPTRNTWKY